jgi:putative transposase
MLGYNNTARWPVHIECQVLGVSASGYFAYQRNQAKSTSTEMTQRMSDAVSLAHIRAIHSQVRGEYGWPRIWHQLKANGVKVGK